ncbi:hypothetical protein PFICI_03137 [Pestalotiopsis fici W106-1]|uniref:Uncharacterized protein n=1 Tax=Pestalotiopsis fici (strain W106-1 / CGMCC3.15140) TaxID=1229662 RepID=W3XI43_PESFW|nr:uncharacterized protein PFICI_03137 [Pestalotiopsis fici W106-1]ETS85112.1 hypothetical protein PFICI_03137 [Pestalotiopsis fici W106-1]
MYGFNYATILALAAGTAATSVSTTPHDSYSSSVGVLGCKIDTNRVAYWPGSVDCNNICVKLTYGDRSVNLLRIDQSGGAYDISYDAWAYLQTGKSASVDAITGGGVDMEYEEVDASECADLIKTDGSKLPLSASNSMNFLASCLAEPDSWVAQNHVLYNICDSVCTLGYDETCTLDLAVSNQPSCSHTLGLTTSLTSTPVYNIEYQSGKVVTAGSGVVASGYTYAEASADSSSDSSSDSDAEVETVATTSAAPAVSTATTSTVDAVFLEVTSSSSSVQEYKTAPATTTAAATTSSFAPAYSTQSTTAAQTTESASSSATTLVSSVQSSTTAGSSSIASTAAGTSSIASSAVPTSANASSTLVVATKSSSQSSATSSGSAATGTAQPITSGANSKVGASVSALISSIAIYLLVSAL